MHRPSSIPPRTYDEAAAWFHKLDHGSVSAADLKTLWGWLGDEANRAAFHAISATAHRPRRYAIQADDLGLCVVDVWTGQPVVLSGRVQRQLPPEQAARVADALNARISDRSILQ